MRSMLPLFYEVGQKVREAVASLYHLLEAGPTDSPVVAGSSQDTGTRRSDGAGHAIVV